MDDFTEEQIERYSRHIILAEVGGKGQKKIRDGSVFIVGAGGLGCPAGYYLAAAGVGRIGIADADDIEISNLQRQIAHNTKRIGMSKADSAKQTFEELNPDVEVLTYKERLTSKNIIDTIKDYQIVIDGSDNFPTRYLINDACVMTKKPLVSGAILRFEGQVTTIIPRKGPCYRCLFESPPPPGLVPSCAEAGVLGVLPGVIGAIQATEALKIMLGKGDLLKGELLIYNALKMSFKKVRIPKNQNCPICGENPSIKELIDYDAFCEVRPY